MSHRSHNTLAPEQVAVYTGQAAGTQKQVEVKGLRQPSLKTKL